MNVSVNDTFVSRQGTGALAGQLQFFVRLQGCSVKCPIRHLCDEPYSLDAESDIASLMSISDIVSLAVESVGKGGWIHITGGEPLDNLSAWKELVWLSMRSGLRVHTQTSGMVPHGEPIGRMGKLTVSPKGPIGNLKVRNGSELILVAAPWMNVDLAKRFMDETSFEYYYICPLHRGGLDWDHQAAYDLIGELNDAGQRGWLLGHQIHKLYGVK